jgi:hypothetical protein
MKINPILFLLIIAVCLFSCEKKTENTVSVVFINELMPVNSTVVADPNGEYNDWIELYNISEKEQDISGWFLSDNDKHISKWQFPASTTIKGRGYLIIWADDDSAQTGLHASFKLSSQGEELILSDSKGVTVDKVLYPGQSLELSYSRNPDGTGAFVWQLPTYLKSNSIK